MLIEHQVNRIRVKSLFSYSLSYYRFAYIQINPASSGFSSIFLSHKFPLPTLQKNEAILVGIIIDSNNEKSAHLLCYTWTQYTINFLQYLPLRQQPNTFHTFQKWPIHLLICKVIHTYSLSSSFLRSSFFGSLYYHILNLNNMLTIKVWKWTVCMFNFVSHNHWSGDHCLWSHWRSSSWGWRHVLGRLKSGLCSLLLHQQLDAGSLKLLSGLPCLFAFSQKGSWSSGKVTGV